MNIEVKIVAPDLAAALNNLAQAISERTGAFVPPTEAEQEPQPEKPVRSAKSRQTTQPTSDQSKADGPEAGTAEKQAPEKSEPASSSSSEGSADLDYNKDIKPLVIQVAAKKGRQAAIDLLAEFDATKGDEIDEARWAEFIARADEVLG